MHQMSKGSYFERSDDQVHVNALLCAMRFQNLFSNLDYSGTVSQDCMIRFTPLKFIDQTSRYSSQTSSVNIGIHCRFPKQYQINQDNIQIHKEEPNNQASLDATLYPQIIP